MRVLVAMSGGVDSSVAAALMVEAGHDVIGVMLKQWEGPGGALPTAGCCTVGDAEDARRVAGQLGVPFYVLDYVAEFREAVVAPFGAGYLAGRTPNPCVECNRRVRFRALLERTAELGCEALVTGHHARIDRRGPLRLLRGLDREKDQSYVLHMLDRDRLARIRFPVGERTKAEVRETAAQLGLRTAAKPESQDICFVGRDDYREFLALHFPETARPGEVIDTAGTVLGRHGGTAGFTIGQRRGLGIAVGEPRFVVEVRPETGTVVVGDRSELLATGCRVEDVSFVSGAPPESARVEVQIRYRSPAVPARLARRGPGDWEVRFDGPQSAVAPGQAAVFYEGDEVLGGGTIAGRSEA
jgi:tRNA-specific 2-thiouridylase